MYHIREDKRSAQSAELIYQCILKLMDQKSYDLISVTDIQRKSGIARTTFYRCFDNISDVFLWKCDEAFHTAFSTYHPHPACQFRTAFVPNALLKKSELSVLLSAFAPIHSISNVEQKRPRNSILIS